jgi:hypothetical protein
MHVYIVRTYIPHTYKCSNSEREKGREKEREIPGQKTEGKGSQD